MSFSQPHITPLASGHMARFAGLKAGPSYFFTQPPGAFSRGLLRIRRESPNALKGINSISCDRRLSFRRDGSNGHNRDSHLSDRRWRSSRPMRELRSRAWNLQVQGDLSQYAPLRLGWLQPIAVNCSDHLRHCTVQLGALAPENATVESKVLKPLS